MNPLIRLSLKVLFALLLVMPLPAFAGDWNVNDLGVVLDGYDVITYRTEDRAVRGQANYAAKYDGVKFYFANRENRDLFNADPAKYVPKYNGYCAFAVGANGAKVSANPQTFKMYNGELLVFFNDLWEGNQFNTKIPWNKDEMKLFTQAEKNWRNLK